MVGASAGSECEVGAGANVRRGPVVRVAHLSHPFIGLNALPRGPEGGQLFLPSSVVPRWPTGGCAAVSVPSAHGGWLSGEIIPLLAPSPLNRHILPMSVFSQSGVSVGLQSPSTNEQIKPQLNGNGKAALSIKSL